VGFPVKDAVSKLVAMAEHELQVQEKLVTLSLVPVCSRSFLKRHGPLNTAEHLARVTILDPLTQNTAARKSAEEGRSAVP
jgi:hypothetical protein